MKMLPLTGGAGYKLSGAKMLSLTDGARKKLFGVKMHPHPRGGDASFKGDFYADSGRILLSHKG